jgi:hypothetical protein
MVPFVSALSGALGESQLRATRPRIATAVMTGIQAQYDADIKLMTDTALARKFFTLVLGQILIPPSKSFNSAGKIPQTLMHPRTSLIEC